MNSVVHVFKDAYPPTRGGIERHIHDLAHGLNDWHHIVLTSSRSRRRVDETIDGVRYIRMPEYARPTSTPITPHWIGFLRRCGADLVHLHMPNPFGELAWLAARSHIPMVATWHAEIVGRKAVKPLYSPFQQRVLRRARRIIVGSPPLAATTRELADHLQRIAVVAYGVHPAPHAAPLDLPHPLVAFVGRLAYYKGLDVLAEAMRSVDATLAVVGDGNEPLPPGAIHLAGADDAVKYALLRAADVYVAPSTSRAESFGISILEAMSTGTSVITTELGTGTSWVNIHGETGLVVPPRDPGALAGAINRLLADAALRTTMGHAAAARAQTTFSMQSMLDGVRRVYEDVCPHS